MAVSLTLAQLRTAVRAIQSAEVDEILTRLLQVGTERVEQHAPDCPENTQNESVIRFTAYLFDMPNAFPARQDYSSAFRNSGAASLLRPCREHAARSVKP